MGEPGESRSKGEPSVRRFPRNWSRPFLVVGLMRTIGLGLCWFLLAVWESIEFILQSLGGSSLIKRFKESTCSNQDGGRWQMEDGRRVWAVGGRFARSLSPHPPPSPWRARPAVSPSEGHRRERGRRGIIVVFNAHFARYL